MATEHLTHERRGLLALRGRKRPSARHALLTAVLGAAMFTASSDHPAARAVAVRNFVVDEANQTVTLHFYEARGLMLDDGQSRTQIVDDRATIEAQFLKAHTFERKAFELIVRSGVPVGSLSLEYYPREIYQAIGAVDPGYILLVTDLRRLPSDDWPSPDDWQGRATAVSVSDDGEWRHFVREPGQLANSFLDFIALMDSHNDPAGRVLCPDTGSAGLREMVMSGECFVWCEGLSVMMRDLAVAAGHPARRVSLTSPQKELASGVLTQTSEAHATVEVLDNGRWRWLDPSFRIYAARDGSGDSLSVRQVIEQLSDPFTRRGLQFDLVLPGSANLERVGFYDAPRDTREQLLRYLTLDKRLSVET